jgi:hypothetical protein
MSNLFEKKVPFTKDEQEVISLLGSDGIYFNPADRDHKRLRPAMAKLFFMGILDRGDKGLNHFVINELGKKAIGYNKLVDEFKTTN